jgi:hypothetical protein
MISYHHAKHGFVYVKPKGDNPVQCKITSLNAWKKFLAVNNIALREVLDQDNTMMDGNQDEFQRAKIRQDEAIIKLYGG